MASVPASQLAPYTQPPPEPCDVLLIAIDWQSRALILAQLQTEEYDVRAVPGLRPGLIAIMKGRVIPALVLVDVTRDPDASPERLKLLCDLLPHVPVILITGVFEASTYEPLRPRLAAWKLRPVAVGEVVELVHHLLPSPQDPRAKGSRRAM